MKCEKLVQNIIDVIAEQQIKLGYRSETIYLYYPLVSLNSLLGTDNNEKEMQTSLSAFSTCAEKRLGRIKISNEGERFCLAIPPHGADYVHQHIGEHEFLQRFIDVISRHGCTLGDIEKVFYMYSENVTVEEIANGEFDYLIYFTDGKPNDYKYCITFEGCHATYHRFTEEDYGSTFCQ